MKAHATVGNAEPNYARWRFVTENFQSLQGLTWVAFGTAFFLSSIEDAVSQPLPLWLLLLALALVFAAVGYVPKYYQDRFGSVEPRSPTNKQAVIFLLVLLVLGLFGRPLGRYLDSVIPQASNQIHLMISDPDHRATLLPLIFWTVVLCARVFRRSRFASRLDVPFDLTCLLFWFFALVFYPLRHPNVTNLTFWKVLNAGWFGISIIVTGLFDRLTLVALLPSRIRERDNEERKRRGFAA
jgi:hypothetical protein